LGRLRPSLQPIGWICACVELSPLPNVLHAMTLN